MTRRVVLLCGPPGAGKTTAARESGLTVFDRDDPQWGGEKDFTTELRRLAMKRDAQAVVIRSGATSTARARAAKMIGATHTFVILGDRAELAKRIVYRNRADWVRTLASLDKWFESFDRDDGALDFPGWQLAFGPQLGTTSEHFW